VGDELGDALAAWWRVTSSIRAGDGQTSSNDIVNFEYQVALRQEKACTENLFQILDALFGNLSQPLSSNPTEFDHEQAQTNRRKSPGRVRNTGSVKH
jgi:hypothetical protein